MATPKNDCGYTIKTLKEWVELRTREIDGRIADYKLFVAEKFVAGEKAVGIAMAAAEKAAAKAEEAQERRNETLNELRGIVDQVLGTKMGAAEFEIARQLLNATINALDKSLSARITALESGDRGRSQGQHAVWGYLVGAIGILSFIVQAFLHWGKP